MQTITAKTNSELTSKLDALPNFLSATFKRVGGCWTAEVEAEQLERPTKSELLDKFDFLNDQLNQLAGMLERYDSAPVFNAESRELRLTALFMGQWVEEYVK